MKEPKPTERFPIVFFARYQVWGLTPIEIDEMLANGWFRNVQHVQTTLGRFVDGIWKPSLMVRIPLKGFVWKKRLRKLLRQNMELFNVKVQPFEPRKEMDDLWRNFKSGVHNWNTIPDLSSHILKGNPTNAFHTFEVAIYKGSDLVGFSLFDRGHRSIASLEAGYDIRHKSNSLGIFSMLVEIDYCLKNNLDYYYPGFYPKETPMFDYKLRPGNAEFFRAKLGKWISCESIVEEDWLLDKVMQELTKAKRLLSRLGFHSMVKAFNKVGYPALIPATSNYDFLAIAEKQISLHLALLVQVAWDPFMEKFFLFKKMVQLPERSSATQIPSIEPFKLTGEFADIMELEKCLIGLLS